MFSSDFAVYLCVGKVDLRGAVDRLSGIVQQVLELDPRAGALFLFVNRTRNRIKVLWWDRNGYIVLYKRLDRGSFDIPKPDDARPYIELSAAEFAKVLAGERWQGRSPTLH